MQRALCIKILIVVAVLTIPDYRFPTALFAQLTTSSTEILSANLFDDTILVKYKETVLATNDPVQRERKITELSARLHSQYGMTPITTLRIFGIQRLRLGPGQTIDSAIAALVRDPAVEYAERNYRVVPLATPQTPPPTEMEWTSGLLWGLVKIGMKNAWGFSTGGAVDIVVAVIDSGIDNTNFDLRSKYVD